MDATVAWLTSLFPQLAPPTALLIVQVVYAAILSFVAPTVLVVGLTWMERKVAARIQNRIGPNRAGPFGWFQGFADAIKMFTKEDITPTGADRIVYNLAPALAAVGAVLVFAVIPMAPGVIGVESAAVRLIKKSVNDSPNGPRRKWEVIPALSTPPPLGPKSARSSVS